MSIWNSTAGSRSTGASNRGYFLCRRAVRLPLFLLILSLCTCADGARNERAPAGLSGILRYQEDGQIFTATLSYPDTVSPTPPPPRLFGTETRLMDVRGRRAYRLRQPMNYPSLIPLAVTTDGPDVTFDLRFAPVSVAGLPDTIRRSTGLEFMIGTTPLSSGESLLFFFEPETPGEPEQIRLIGPTDTPTIRLRPDVTATLPSGDYLCYLIKQKTVREETQDVELRLQLEYITRTTPVVVAE